MKKLLKSIICGIHKQYTKLLFMEEKSKSYHRKKKKKKILKHKRAHGKRVCTLRARPFPNLKKIAADTMSC